MQPPRAAPSDPEPGHQALLPLQLCADGHLSTPGFALNYAHPTDRLDAAERHPCRRRAHRADRPASRRRSFRRGLDTYGGAALHAGGRIHTSARTRWCSYAGLPARGSGPAHRAPSGRGHLSVAVSRHCCEFRGRDIGRIDIRHGGPRRSSALRAREHCTRLPAPGFPDQYGEPTVSAGLQPHPAIRARGLRCFHRRFSRDLLGN